MTRAAMLAALIVGIAMQAAAAEPFYREDVRIPIEAAGPRGLEAMLLRPSGTVKQRKLPSPPVRGTRPIARYMQSTIILPTPPAPDRAEGFSDFRPAVQASTPRGRPGRRSP
jgi:hypothetical protein